MPFLKHILRNIGNIVFYCPLRLVTLEALQELVDWYKEYTFEALAQSQDNPETTLMFLDLVSSEDLDKINAWKMPICKRKNSGEREECVYDSRGV